MRKKKVYSTLMKIINIPMAIKNFAHLLNDSHEEVLFKLEQSEPPTNSNPTFIPTNNA